MTLHARDTRVRELMDDPDCDPVMLATTLRRFETVNRLVSGWGRIYRSRLAPALAALGRPARVLDLGCGGGDLVVRLARLARRDGLDVHWLGADPDARALEVATRSADHRIAFRAADAAELLAAGERFDAVISNHVLHHLGDDLASFAAESRRLSHGVVLHGDIARSRRAYALYAVGITPLAPGSFLRTDGLRSIRRSFTPTELADELAVAASGVWSVGRPAPFRLLAEATGDA